MVLIGCCEAVIAIFFPPLAVLLRKGCSGSLLINILLTILGWIPGVIHAWFIIAAEPGHHHDKHPRTSHSSRHRHSSGGRHHHHHGHGGGSSHAGRHHHHHGHHGSHTGRHHSRPPRKSYDRDGYGGGIAPPRYGGPPPIRPGSGYGPPPPPMQEMGYAPPPMRSRY